MRRYAGYYARNGTAHLGHAGGHSLFIAARDDMAKIRLYRDEVRADTLPPVCMRCGAAATVYRGKNFSWNPTWVWFLLLVGLLPFLIVALVTSRRMRVNAPLCDLHRNHWLNRGVFTYGGLIAMIIVGIGLIVAISVAEGQKRQVSDEVRGWACAGGVVLGVIYVIAAIVVESRTIRPTQITKNTITLVRVSPQFVDAIEAQRDEEEEDGTAARKARIRRRRYGDDYQD